MTVKEAIDLLAYGTEFYLIGSYSGKIYHRSWTNTEEHLKQFLDNTTYSTPFRADIYPRKNKFQPTYGFGVIGIYFYDYELCNKEDGT